VLIPELNKPLSAKNLVNRKICMNTASSWLGVTQALFTRSVGTRDGFAIYQFVECFRYTPYNNEYGGLVFKSGEGALEMATGTKVYSRRETCPMVARYRGSDKK